MLHLKNFVTVDKDAGSKARQLLAKPLVAIHPMRLTTAICTYLLSFAVLAQFDYLDQRDLYVKYNIQEVNSFDHDSGSVINDEQWIIDEMGRIYSHKLLETEDDPIFDLTQYFYSNDALIKSIHIGFWHSRANKIDTGVTIYNLNESGKPIQRIYFNTRNNDTLTSICTYEADRFISEIFYDSFSDIYRIDSSNYYNTGVRHISSRTRFAPILSLDTVIPDQKMLQYFDTTGKINLEVEFAIDDNRGQTLIKSKSFVYENNRLVRIIALYLGTQEHLGSRLRKTEEYFFYDDRGFVTKIEWYSDGKRTPYLVYSYEYK